MNRHRPPRSAFRWPAAGQPDRLRATRPRWLGRLLCWLRLPVHRTFPLIGGGLWCPRCWAPR